MKKIHFIFIGLCLWASFSQGQENQRLVLTCEDVTENCATLFVHYYKAGNMDSVAIIMDYWEEKCGNIEQIQRARILCAIDQKRYNDAVLKAGILENVLDYKEKEEENSVDSKKDTDAFDIFTQQLADSIMNRYSKTGISYAWCEFYGKNPDRLFKRIQNREFDESTLAQEYFSEVDKLKINGFFHIAVLVGAWIPFGKMSEFGPHPEIGYSVGGGVARFNFDVSVGYRFVHTSETEIQYKDLPPIKADRFSGYFLGVDIGVSILRKRQHELLCVGGFGYESLNVVSDKKIPAIESNYLNFGAGYRFHFQSNTYLGVQVKYNVVHYLSGSAFNDSGNALLTRVSFGWTSRGKKARELSRLQYDYK
ncbi:MAG: hypothetical protein FWG84_00620 [Bacteroidales bacterium]|nr:hypothetical protein [Bacteroidales bacterium]